MGNCNEYTALKIGALLHDIESLFKEPVINQNLKDMINLVMNF